MNHCIRQVGCIIYALLASTLAGCAPNVSINTPQPPLTVPSETNTAMLTPATPTITSTAISVTQGTAGTPTPTLLPTPTLAPVMVNDLNDLNYGVAWAVPVEWTDISAQLPPPGSSIHLWNRWASDPEAVTLLAATPATFPDGLMLLTLSVHSIEP